MQPNTNQETGIPFGVISARSIDSDVFTSLLDNGTDRNQLVSTIQFVVSYMEQVGIPVSPDLKKLDVDLQTLQGYADRAEFLASKYDIDLECMNMDFVEPCVFGEADGVRYMIDQLGGAYLLTVLESPFMAHANKCSPCCPNAGDLDNLNEYGSECYDIHPSWKA